MTALVAFFTIGSFLILFSIWQLSIEYKKEKQQRIKDKEKQIQLKEQCSQILNNTYLMDVCKAQVMDGYRLAEAVERTFHLELVKKSRLEEVSKLEAFLIETCREE